MELYSNNDYRYYLSHHGVKEQKWGVRHGPPYPLNKEGKAKFNADVKDRKQKERMSGGVGSSYLSAHDSEWQEMEVRYFQNGNVGYFPAAKVIKDFENEGLGNPYPKMFRDGTSWDCARTNPDYPQDGCTNNCTKCTSAMELRKRGYDVRAGRQSNGARPDVFEYWWDGAEKYEFENASTDEDRRKITETLTNFGDGASGSITLTYGDGSNGHAIYWTTDGAQVYFYDGQNGKSIVMGDRPGDQLGKVYDTYRFNPENSVLVYRLDQATPNWDHMAEDSVIRPPERSGSKVKNKNSGRVVDRW